MDYKTKAMNFFTKGTVIEVLKWKRNKRIVVKTGTVTSLEDMGPFGCYWVLDCGDGKKTLIDRYSTDVRIKKEEPQNV